MGKGLQINLTLTEKKVLKTKIILIRNEFQYFVSQIEAFSSNQLSTINIKSCRQIKIIVGQKSLGLIEKIIKD